MATGELVGTGQGGVTQAQRTWGEEEEDCFLTVGCAGKMNSGPK